MLFSILRVTRRLQRPGAGHALLANLRVCLTVHFLISCLGGGEEEEMPKIFQDKLVGDISKGWGRKGLAGGPRAASRLGLSAARPTGGRQS